ncbi:lysozyme-like protein [Sistotremastrum suecicum HHB10207 ss-3]|uniref:Lysozyme-like protein n=1 Tax=Sistotremastrum suecicum HHB10207 ss-3 TaxID=1314776 RepID=A0A166ICS2_9AGAM|nr:lysozyme-like protein [Sistotremastrum suecicum HHB10207 ss-3]
MNPLSFLSLFSALILVCHAGNALNHDILARHHARGHKQLAKKQSLTPKSNIKCRARPASSKSSSKSSTHASTSTAPVNPASTPSSSSSPPSGGIIKVNVPRCGPNGATKEVTATTGPNGSLDWLNCGVTEAGGWNPPFMSVDDIMFSDLNTAASQPGSPFQACSSYTWAFEQYGKQYGVPPILLASFALQESSCNPGTVGGAGEQGLMQLTPDKCTKAPGGNCKDVGYNVQTGASFVSDLLSSNNGNLVLSVGKYNGWDSGMTIASATAAGNTPCCRCQNNLDYVFQVLNGWILNVDAYTHNPPLGKYFNLNKCQDS